MPNITVGTLYIIVWATYQLAIPIFNTRLCLATDLFTLTTETPHPFIDQRGRLKNKVICSKLLEDVRVEVLEVDQILYNHPVIN